MEEKIASPTKYIGIEGETWLRRRKKKAWGRIYKEQGPDVMAGYNPTLDGSEYKYREAFENAFNMSVAQHWSAACSARTTPPVSWVE